MNNESKFYNKSYNMVRTKYDGITAVSIIKLMNLLVAN